MERFLPVGAWAPDNLSRDNDSLEQARNLLPIFQTYRLVPELVPHSVSPDNAGDSYPLTGGISHLLDLSQAVFFMRPSSDSIATPAGYVNELGSAVDLFASIDETSPDATDFFYSRSDNDLVRARFGFPDLTFAPPNDNNHVLRWQYQVFDPNNLGWTVRVYLTDGNDIDPIDPGADPIEKLITGTGSRLLTHDQIALTPAQAAAIISYQSLNLNMRGTMDTAPGVRELFPVIDLENTGAWVDTPLHEKVGNFADDGEFITVPVGTSNKNVKLGLESGNRPVINVEHKIRFRARRTAAPASLASIIIFLRDESKAAGSKEIARTQTQVLSTTFTDYEYVLTTGEIEELGGKYVGLNLLIRAVHVEDDANIELSAVSFEYPDAEGVIFTWGEFQIPDVEAQNETDVIRRYVGDKERLYEIRNNEGEWRDVTRLAGLYAQAGVIPQSWSFTSFGQDVIATNFEDPVQILTPGDVNFEDLIGTVDEPRSKYAITVQGHLVLCNINPSSITSNPIIVGSPEMIWWSANRNASQFYIADLTTQSGLTTLLETPGAINGAVGGEWGTLFKRTSIYRLNYIGPPFIFGKDVLSYNIGCHYPRSIVQVGQDIYFVDIGGLYAIQNGEGLQRIGDQQVLRFLFDSRYSDESVSQTGTIIGTEKDSVVVGTYFPIIDCIFWMYIKKGDSFNQATRVLVFHVRENRFSLINLPDLVEDPAEVQVGRVATDIDVFDHVMGEKNLESSVEVLTRAALIFTWDTDDAALTKHAAWSFSSGVSLAATLVSKELSSGFIRGQRDGEERRNIQINAVRLIFNLQNEITQPPDYDVVIEYSEHPFREVAPFISSATGAHQTESGWVTLDTPAHGGYFRWAVTIPSQSANDLTDIMGLELLFEVAGLE